MPKLQADPEYDEPVNIDMDPEDALRMLTASDPGEDVIEPALDE